MENGRQSVESSSTRFESLNMLGFQPDLASMCGLAKCSDRFCCSLILKTVQAKMAAKRQVSIAPKVVKFVVGK